MAADDRDAIMAALDEAVPPVLADDDDGTGVPLREQRAISAYARSARRAAELLAAAPDEAVQPSLEHIEAGIARALERSAGRIERQVGWSIHFSSRLLTLSLASELRTGADFALRVLRPALRLLALGAAVPSYLQLLRTCVDRVLAQVDGVRTLAETLVRSADPRSGGPNAPAGPERAAALLAISLVFSSAVAASGGALRGASPSTQEAALALLECALACIRGPGHDGPAQAAACAALCSAVRLSASLPRDADWLRAAAVRGVEQALGAFPQPLPLRAVAAVADVAMGAGGGVHGVLPTSESTQLSLSAVRAVEQRARALLPADGAACDGLVRVLGAQLHRTHGARVQAELQGALERLLLGAAAAAADGHAALWQRLGEPAHARATPDSERAGAGGRGAAAALGSGQGTLWQALLSTVRDAVCDDAASYNKHTLARWFLDVGRRVADIAGAGPPMPRSKL